MAAWQRLMHKLGVQLKMRDPPNVPTYAWSYFDHLVALYLTLNAEDPRADVVIKKAKDTPDLITWGDIFFLENVIFSLQPVEIIERNAWVLRERFRQTASPTVYDKYIESAPPKESDTPAKLALLKADLSRVLDILHWHYSLIPIREHIRKRLTINCVWLIFTYTIVLGIALRYFQKEHWDWAAMLLGVLYCGVIGGFVSSQRRMQSVPTDADPLISIFGLDGAGYFLWLSPLLGAIFAMVLTAMFIAGILKGTVFPEFAGVAYKNVSMGFFNFAWHTLPTGTEEYAKLFVWAFLAGFAERLVPDSLDHLTDKLSTSKQTGPATAPAGAGVPPIKPDDHSAEHKPTVAAETLQDAMHTGETTVSLPPAKKDET